MISFMKRHESEISTRKAELLKQKRAEAEDPEIVENFMRLVEKSYKIADINQDDLNDAKRIFNIDETGFRTGNKLNNVIVGRGRPAQVLAPTEGKTNFSVLFAGNAAGNYLPPYVVYKGTDNSMPCSWLLNGPRGAGYATTKNGWMDTVRFEAYIPWINQEITALKIKKPVVMFLDGYSSHLSYNCVRTAKDLQIILVKLPPNSTHLLQVLDVSVFKPAKAKWSNIVKSWFRQTRFESISKSVFPTLLSKLFDALVEKPEYLINGFRATGIWPLNKDLILKKVEDRGIYSAIKGGLETLDYDLDENSPGPSSEICEDPIKITNNFKTPVTKKKNVDQILSPSTKALANAVRRTLVPERDPITVKGIENNKLKIKVKKDCGSILTEFEALSEIKKREDEKVNRAQNKTTAKERTRAKELKKPVKKKYQKRNKSPQVEEDSDTDFTPLLRKPARKKVSEVYSDFDSEEEVESKEGPPKVDGTGGGFYIGPLAVGDYVLARFEGLTEKDCFIYICRIREVKEPLFEVQGLKACDAQKCTFMQKENDISLIGRSDVVNLVNKPKPLLIKRKTVYKFEKPQPVKELI